MQYVSAVIADHPDTPTRGRPRREGKNLLRPIEAPLRWRAQTIEHEAHASIDRAVVTDAQGAAFRCHSDAVALKTDDHKPRQEHTDDCHTRLRRERSRHGSHFEVRCAASHL